MPITYSNSSGFLDAGIAIGLLPTKSYAQARADRGADMQYTLGLADLYKNQLSEKQAFEQKINKQFAALKSLGIEQPDQERLNLFVNDLRGALTKKIMDKYDGDVRKYMMYEGDNDLQDYTMQIIDNPLFKSAITNKSNLGVYTLDKKDGKDYTRKVSYALIDGTKKENVSFDEAVSDYYSYKTNELPYNGAFKKPKEAFEFFTKNLHPDPLKRYGVKDENGNIVAPSVSPQEYYDYLTNNKDNPLSKEDAAQLTADEYPTIAPSLKWATDNLQKYGQENDKLSLEKWKAKDASARGWAQVQNGRVANALKAHQIKTENQPPIAFTDFLQGYGWQGDGSQRPLNDNERATILKTLKDNPIGSFLAVKDGEKFDPKNSKTGKEIILNKKDANIDHNITSVGNSLYRVMKPVFDESGNKVGEKASYYLPITADMKEADLKKLGVFGRFLGVGWSKGFGTFEGKETPLNNQRESITGYYELPLDNPVFNTEFNTATKGYYGKPANQRFAPMQQQYDEVQTYDALTPFLGSESDDEQ